MSENSEFTVPEGRSGTQVVINLANTIDYADQQIGVSVYNSIETQFHLTTTELGLITSARTLLQSVANPFWGVLADKYSRKKILAFGCFLWGIITILVGLSQNYNQMLIARGVNGIALAIITPVTYSLVADYFRPNERGKAFGYLGLTSIVGAVFGTLYATTIAGGSPIFGFDGWRIAYFSFGIISLILALLVLLFAKDPVRGGTESGFLNKGINEEKYSVKMSHFKQILSTKTFLVIVSQGMVGSLPWSAFGFIILWFQYIGLDDFTAALSFGIVAIGAAFGNLFGGVIGDRVAKWNEDKGRIIVAMISIFSGIPLTFIMFELVPRNASSLPIYLVIGFLTGFAISWVAPAANNPILGEIIEPEARSTAYSVDRLFEGGFSAWGAFFVGFLAQDVFGYVERTESISSLPQSVRTENINAIANSMFAVALVGWTLCLLIYSLTLLTYKKDRDRVREHMKLRLLNNNK